MVFGGVSEDPAGSLGQLQAGEAGAGQQGRTCSLSYPALISSTRLVASLKRDAGNPI